MQPAHGAHLPATGGRPRIDYAWGGFVDISMNRAPDFGRLPAAGGMLANVYYLQGFSGHGLALTGLAGKLVAEAIAGDAGRFDTFARIQPPALPRRAAAAHAGAGAGHGVLPTEGPGEHERRNRQARRAGTGLQPLLGEHPFHIAGKKYIDSVRLAGCLPLVVPSAGPTRSTHCSTLADGVLLTGSPSNVHPSHFGEGVHNPDLPLDPERDALDAAADSQGARARPAAACHLPRHAGNQRGARRHAAPGGAGAAGPCRPPCRPLGSAEVQYGLAHEVEVVPGGVLPRILDRTRFKVNSVHGQAVNRLAGTCMSKRGRPTA